MLVSCRHGINPEFAAIPLPYLTGIRGGVRAGCEIGIDVTFSKTYYEMININCFPQR